MNHRGARSWTVAATALLLLGLTACGTEAPAPPPAEPTSAPASALLPPRPMVLRLDGVQPCSLLTAQEVARLGVRRIGPAWDNTSSCDWQTPGMKLGYGFSASLERQEGAEVAAQGEGAQVVSVGGFPAVRTASAIFDPTYSCIYVVDVAPGQILGLFYENTYKDIPGMNHELACQRAAQVAELMVANLRRLAR